MTEPEVHHEAPSRRRRELLVEMLGICLVKSFNFLGFAGVTFIVYGSVATTTGETWKPLERVADPLAAALTVLGTILTAASVYAFNHITRPPTQFSKWVSAPIVIVSGLVALGALVEYHWFLPARRERVRTSSDLGRALPYPPVPRRGLDPAH